MILKIMILFNIAIYIPMLYRSSFYIKLDKYKVNTTQQAQYIEIMLVECWPIICDAAQHLTNIGSTSRACREGQ